MLRLAIQRPIAISMLFLALVLIGGLSFQRLPVDLLPSITYPRLTVVTTYEDIPAEDLERLVTQPLEEVVTALAGVRSVVSRTREGVSTITAEYEWGTQMDFANLHLREAVDRVSFRDDFPEEAARPLILRWDPTSRPVSVMVVEGDDPVPMLTDFAREVVKPALEQVDGVSQAEVVGGAEREILVRPDPERLAIYDITIEDIRQALIRSNISFPGGKIRQGPLHLSLRISGEFETLEQIAATDIPHAGRTPVRISDVAEVLDTVKEPEGITLLNDRPVVSLLIYKEPDANTIQVSKDVDVALEVLSADYADFGYNFVYRDAEYVRASFRGLTQSLVIGAGFAFFVLFFFLRDVRSPFVVGLAIPVSILITFALLYFGKVSLNLMSLGGLSLAVGMLVDNSIVVLENINRHLSERKKKQTVDSVDEPRVAAAAAEAGTREMARPVVAATLTTVAVFFPVVYVPGIAGAFFRDQALTVTFSLLVSIAAALLLQPMLSARLGALLRIFAGLIVLLGVATGAAFLLGRVVEAVAPFGPRLLIALGASLGLIVALFLLRPLFPLFEAVFNTIHRAYHRTLARSLRRPIPLLGALAVGLAVVLVLGSRVERSFMPERSSGDLRVDLELPPGTPLEQTEEAVARFASWVSEEPGVKWVFSQVGRTERTLAALRDYTAPNTARVRILFHLSRSTREQSVALQERASARLQELSGVDFVFREEGVGLAEILASGEAAFVLGVVADEPLTALESAEGLAAALESVPGLIDIRVDRVLGTPNLVVRLNREEILRSGLDPDRVSRELVNRVSGVEATTFNELEERIDIAVRLEREERRDLATLLSSPVEVQGGRTVPLRTFLDLREERPVRELVRRNQRRMVTVTAGVRGRSLNAVWKDAEAAIAQTNLPSNVIIVPAGDRDAMRKSFRDLGWAMALAALLVYMILAAQFESFLDPLLIAAVIPMGLAGAVLAIALSGNTINILSLIGAVALLGIAVNDAIVKLDTVRRLRAKGMEGEEALLMASQLRFRPILMTSSTTILAMVPMAIGLGSGEQLQRPLAITIIGGLALTTFLTLFYTPIMYKVAHRIRGREMEETATPEAREA